MKTIILLILISLLSFSCTQDSITQQDNGTGQVFLNLDKTNIPDEVVLIKVELLSDEFENQESEISPQSENDAEIYFNAVESGNWEIKISAYNSEEQLIYFGKTNISVMVGEVTSVVIALERVNGSTTGSVYIYITWNDNVFRNWLDNPANPILEKQGNWLDYKGIAQPFIVKTDDKYYMWYTGLSGSSSHIYAATSEDGLHWTPYSTEPVISPDTASYWESRNVATGIVIFENGLFKMYYTGRSTAETDYSPWYIGLAVSEDGFHWSKRENPVFSGAIGQWDLKIATASIQIIDGVYYMYYTGKTYLNDHQIGLATSTDGINWERYGSNPIFSNMQYWEGAGYYYPTVLKINEKYYMIYMNSVSNVSGFGYATSTDGINWVKSESNPFITSDETINKWDRILYPNIIELEDEYRIYYTGYNISQDERAICVLRSFK